MSAVTARQRGHLLLRTGRPRVAVDAYCEALAHEPDDPDTHAWLALALLGSKRVHAARVEARIAGSIAADRPLPIYALARVAHAERRWKEAEELFTQLVAIEPEDADNWRAYAATVHGRGDRKRAMELLERARAVDPASPDVLADLAVLHLEAGRLDEAEQLARDALGEQAEHAEASVVMGRVLLERGKVEEARELAIHVLRHRPDDPGALLLLVAVKARTSWYLGLWWRYHTRLVAFGDLAWLVLLVAFVAQRFLVLLAADLGPEWLADGVQWAWLAFVAYTWIGPSLFRRALQKELQPVRLRPEF